MNSLFKWLVCLAFLAGCAPDEAVSLEQLVDAELVTYFERFADEAASRGITIDWEAEAIYASFTDIEDDAAGQCLTFTNNIREINIDQSYWRRNGAMDREFLIFHELGHCLLGRSHLDMASPSGTCLSMMNSGTGSCSKNYNLTTRSDYLDELFDE